MDKDELFEEIRTLLREGQASTVERPWIYGDMDLIVQVRSAFRYLRAIGYKVEGLPFAPTMDEHGIITSVLTETEGVVVAHFVAARLLAGDLVQKLAAGELGVSYKSGFDAIDTTAAARAFQSTAKEFRDQFDAFVTIALSNAVNELDSVFGDQSPYEA